MDGAISVVIPAHNRAGLIGDRAMKPEQRRFDIFAIRE